MSDQPKSSSPSMVVKLIVAVIIGGALFAASAFFIFAYVARIGGSPGFFGTRASLFADLNLVAEVILLFGLTAGFAFARMGNISLHQYNQTAWALFNIVLTIFIMGVAFARQVVPGIPAEMLQAYYAVSFIHGLLGLVTVLCAIYIILRMNKLLPKFLRIPWWKGLMRITLGLYWIVGLFGFGTYFVWYIMPREGVATTPVALTTPEPGGKVIVPIANYSFVPNDLTIPVGTTVIFQNVDPDPHTVTFDNDEFPSLGFGPGDQFEMTFDTVGVFQIYCEFHGSPGLKGMSATIRVVPADELAAIPTSVTVPTATPRPTLEPFPTQSFTPNGVGLFQDSQSANDTFNLTVSNLPANPPGDYHAWLTGEGAALDLGAITPDAAGDIHLLYLAPTGENLLAGYSGFIITVEAAGSIPAQPSSSVIFGGVISPSVLGPARQLLAAGDNAPDQKGYVIGLVEQAEEMLRHAREIDNAAQAGDTASMNRHIEHLTAILAGKGSPEYIDFEGDGFITDPGDGFGILNYAAAIAEQAQAVVDAPNANEAERAQAAQLIDVANAIQVMGVRLIQLRLAAHEAKSSADQLAHTVEILAIADQLLKGRDANGNGIVEPVIDEGGAYTAYFQSQYLSAMGVLTQEALAALPTAGPPTPTTEPGQPTATPAPTNTPEASPTPGPVIVVFRNFEIVPAELTIKAGTTVIFQIQDSQHEVYESFPGSIDIAGTFDSGPLSPGETFTLTFNNPRTLTIRCGFHPSKMVMTLNVVP